VPLPHSLKDVLKRGALVAAANWPSPSCRQSRTRCFKLLIAAPLVGGVFLVALVVGAEPVELMSLEWRQMAATIASSLLVRPVVLTAWVASLAVVLVGGSLFVFLVKGGTVGVLVRGERHAGTDRNTRPSCPSRSRGPRLSRWTGSSSPPRDCSPAMLVSASSSWACIWRREVRICSCLSYARPETGGAFRRSSQPSSSPGSRSSTCSTCSRRS